MYCKKQINARPIIDFVAPSVSAAVTGTDAVSEIRVCACVRVSDQRQPDDYVALYSAENADAGNTNGFVAGTQHLFANANEDNQWSDRVNTVCAVRPTSDLPPGEYRFGYIRCKLVENHRSVTFLQFLH